MKIYRKKKLRTQAQLKPSSKVTAPRSVNSEQSGREALYTKLQQRLLYELKNPLTIVIAKIQELSTRYPGSGSIIQDILEQSREIEQLNDVMGSLLQLHGFAPPSLNELPKPNEAEQDGPAALQFKNLSESFALQASRNNIHLSYYVEESLPTLTARRFYLKAIQLLLQAAISRCKAMAPAGERLVELSIRYNKRSDELWIQTEDTAITGRSAQKNAGEEDAIELLIVRFLTACAGGHLKKEADTGLNRIQLRLPATLPSSFKDCFSEPAGNAEHAPEEPSQPVARSVPSGQTPAFRAKVMVVDDDPQMRSYLAVLLKNIGYEVVEAENGMDALSLLDTQNRQKSARDQRAVELLVSDLMMPVMDGFTLAKELKKRPGLSDLPCIFVTARADQEGKLKALRLGINDYLTKPFEASELEARCRNLLHLSNARAAARFQKTPPAQEAPEPAAEEGISTRFRKLVLDNITNSKMTLPEIAFELNLSERNLYRIVKRETGLTPNAFIREVRLLKARELLETRQPANLKQLGYDVGIPQSSYLKKLYIMRFGKDPMKLLGRS